MGDTLDETPPTRRDKPQTLNITPEEAAEAENATEDAIGSVSSTLNASVSSSMHYARNRTRYERERERERERDHSSDGVSKRNDEFVGVVTPPRRESLNSCESQQQTQANSPGGFSSSLNKALGLNNRATNAASSTSAGRYSSSSIVVGGGVGNLPGTTTRKCVLTLDGYSYVIVASTPETLPSKREEANSGSGGSNNSSVGGGVASGGGGGAGGATAAATSVPDNGEQSPTSCDLGGNATINGQVAKHGSLTIVRRSNSRKNFTQIDSQTQSIASPSSASISFFQAPLSESLAERLSARGTNGSSASGCTGAADKRFGDCITAAPTTTTTATTTISSISNSAGKMQPSSPNQTNFATDNTQIARPTERQTYDYRLSRDTIEYPNSIIVGPTGSILNSGFDHSSDHSVESGSNLSMSGIWETDNLPPVDTPDALNKAAIRIRSLLRRMDHETVAYEDMQRNLHYAARVLEAVFIDESRSPTTGKSKLGQIASSSVESEDEPAKQRCNDGSCKNLNNNNSANSSCTLHNAATEEQTSQSPANASDNQTSMESRTKGVSMAPQTHSGPTGPPSTTETGEGESEVATKTLETVAESAQEEHAMGTVSETATATTTTTTATTTATATDASEATTSSGAGQSVSSSSSCSNNATVQRQRRLRTPVWARSMSTNKTYLKNGLLLHKLA